MVDVAAWGTRAQHFMASSFEGDRCHHINPNKLCDPSSFRGIGVPASTSKVFQYLQMMFV